MRIEQLKAEREVMQGQGNARNLAPGYLFKLLKYPRSDQNQQYLIEAADYRFEENVYRSDGAGGAGNAKRGGTDSPTTYRLAVQAVPSKVPYPIITGRVYNAMQMPPWDLPANKTQSGFLTRSSKGGTPGHGLHNSPGTANAIRFEDKAGQEQLWLHAQKDQLTEVESPRC